MTSRSTNKTCRTEFSIPEAEHNLEQAALAVSGETGGRYILDENAAQRFLTALERPSPDAERGLRRLTERPSVVRKA